MKKIFCSLLLLMFIKISEAQVLVNFQLPPSGIYTKNQLWNFSVINSGNNNINIKINLSFTDVISGQSIFTASSGIYTLTQQVTQIQANDLTPIVYTVLNNSYNVDLNPDGFLPIGQFEVCITVLQLDNDLVTRLTEDCVTIEVEPLSPPMLSEPTNGEPTYVKRPFFSWLPPAPLAGFSNLTYDFSLVEVESIQSPGDAIQQNIPIYSLESFSANSFLYPSSLPELDTSKLYAWQVAAKSNNSAIAKSEIYTFNIRDYTLDTVPSASTEYYVPLKKENDASYTSFSSQIKFEYLNELNDSIAIINIHDISTAESNQLQLDSPVVHLAFGQNFIAKDISGYSGFIEKHIYLLELINSKQERWYLKFEYR